MTKCKLRNGATVLEKKVSTVKVKIDDLMQNNGEFDNTIAVMELRQRIADPSHKIEPMLIEILKSVGLVDAKGQLDEDTQNIIISMIPSRGGMPECVDPIVEILGDDIS